MKKTLKEKVFVVAFAVLTLWFIITFNINRFMHPEKTEIELFLNIPKSFLLNFN